MAKGLLFAILFAFSVDAVRGSCPNGWKSFGNSCYLFALHSLKTPSMTWEDARAYCTGFGGDLVSITNISEVNFIFKQTNSLGNYKFWIGLYRNKTTSDPKEGWVWSDGSNFTNPQQWHFLEPNNYKNNEKCAELFAKSTKWNDNDCKKKYSSICERKEGDANFTIPTTATLPPTKDPPLACDAGWTSYKRSCYKLERVLRSWSDAKKACRDTGGHLAKIDNSDEQSFMTHTVRSFKQNFWIGLNDLEVAGRWVWESDKMSAAFTHWQSGEPNGLNKERCVEMYGYAQAGFWNDGWCTSTKWSICEKEEGKNMCPENWVPYNDSCYQFNLGPSQRLSWIAAKNSCSSTGGFSSLVTIKSKEEQDFITKQAQSITKTDVWIGLSDIAIETVFKWSDGSSLSDTRFSPWANGKPTENLNNKDCVLMIGARIDGAWSVQLCALKLNFICMRNRDLSFCNIPLGMENGNIPNSQISASSSLSTNTPKNARFRRSGSWCPAKADKNEYLQIDLGSLYEIKKIVIEGNVTSVSIRYGRDGKKYQDYKSLLKPRGSNPIDLNSVTARFIRVYPLKWTGYPCLRLELIGCAAQVPKTADCSGSNWEKGPGNLCYQINRNYRTWTDARSTCLDQGADLLSITTSEEKIAITRRTKPLVGVYSFWISLNDRDFEGIPNWSNGEANGIFVWGSGSPSSRKSDSSYLKACVELRTSSGTWADISCNSRRPFICMKRDNSPSYGDVVKNGLTGIWMGSTKYYWPFSTVENGNTVGTKPGKINGVVKLTYGVKNVSNTGLAFSGSGSFIDAGDFDKECLTFPDACSNGLTLSFMASFDSKAVNWQKRINIFDSMGGVTSSVGLSIYVENKQLWFVVSKTNVLWKEKMAIVGDKTWRHYVMSWNDSGLYMYINAQLKATGKRQTTKASPNDKQKRFFIGIQKSTPVISGQVNLAMVAFWERILSEKDIASIYKAEFGRCPYSWIEFGMACYQFNLDAKTFFPATRHCGSLGGDLVDIASSVQQSFVMQHLYQSSWIGVHDQGQEGVYKQTKDDVIKYSNWNAGEPNNYQRREDCTEILQETGLWNDLSCYWNRKPYICQKQKALSIKPVNDSILDILKFQRICHYSDARIGCPSGFFIKINSAFWGRRRRDLCQYISIINCGLDKIETTTKSLQEKCDNTRTCALRASEKETYLTNPCPGVKKYLEVNYTCVTKSQAGSKCPSGWKISRDNRGCYRLFDTPKKWTDAKQICQSNNANLISIASALEQSMATYLMERTWYANVWTGLNDLKTKGVYQWSDGTPVAWTNWYVGQPDERRTDKSCVYMSLQRTRRDWMFWSDTNCSNTFAFMCKKTLGSQQKPTTKPVSKDFQCGQGLLGYSSSPYCYQVINQPKTWPEAELHCRNTWFVAGQLVSIYDTNENDFIRKLSNDSMWIGLDARGVYRGHAWSDGKPVSYTNWDIGQPDSYNGLEACVQINPDRGYWSDVNCYATRPFVCKTVKFNSQNLAFGKRTVQSTTAYGGISSRAVDGDRNSNYFAMSCTHTSRSYSPWLRIDLGYQYNVSYLIITNRGDCCFQRLSNFEIRISNTLAYNRNMNSKCGGFHSIGNGETKKIICPISIQGRYVNIKIPGWYKVLTLCEVEVYAQGQTVVTLPTPTPYPTSGSTFCKQGWILFNRMCYFIGNDSSIDIRDWHDAESTCRSMNGHLASINNEAEERFLKNVMMTRKSWNYWIGLNDLGSESNYKWIDGIGYGGYTNWDVNEPNDASRQEDCVHMERTHGKWNDNHCSKKFSYICKSYNESYHPVVTTGGPRPQKDGYCAPGWIVNGQWCYEFHIDPSDKMSWQDARDACESGRNSRDLGKLVSITDALEQAFITIQINGAKAPLWIGLNSLHSYRQFRWVDNYVGNYFNWNTGEPRYLWRSRFVEIVPYRSVAGRWNAVTSSTLNGYICKTAASKTPITATPAYTPTPSGPPSFTCPQGYKVYEESCYKFVNTPKTFDDAQKACNNEKAELMNIDSQFKQAYLIFILERFIGSVWIGLLHKPYSTFMFTDHSSPTYTYWGRGQPNRQLDQRSCAQVNITGSNLGLWDDVDCSKTNPFVCQIYNGEPKITIAINSTCTKGWRQYDKSCYKHFDYAQTWSQAQHSCSIIGSDLVSIHDDHEQDFLISYYQDKYPDAIWTGLNDRNLERGYKWIDNTALDYVNWRVHQPDDHKGSENCVEMQTRSGQWNDLSCSISRKFLCKHKLECSSTLSINPSMITVTDSSNASSLGASQAIINDDQPNGFAWCTNNTSGTSKIKVDFNRLVRVTKISIKGRSLTREFVKSFRIDYSQDEYSRKYTFLGVQTIIPGNTNPNIVVTRTLERPITLDSITITPVTWNDQEICMQFLLHGCDYVCQSNLIRAPGKLKDDFITAKSAKLLTNPPNHASSRGNGWCAKSNDKQQWIQVNFDNEHVISKIRTYGDRKESYVKSYKIQFSDDGDHWNDYQQHGVVRIFKGNNDAQNPMVHTLSNTIEAIYVRILPLAWNKNICMRFTLLGCEADCGKPLLETRQGDTDVTLSSSDEKSHPEYALFNSGKAWCTNKSPLNTQYLQIDFGGQIRLTKIATQGSPLSYGKLRQVSSFTLQYTKNSIIWRNYQTTDKRQTKIFIAVNQKDTSARMTNVLNRRGLLTRKIRIFPNDFKGTEICMRVEIYGCYSGVEIIPTTESTQQNIVAVSVKFTSIEWDENLSDDKSEKFATVSQKIENEVRSVYKESESFRDVKVQTLSKGSVIATLNLVFNPAFNESKTQPLLDAVKTGKVGSLDVDKNYFKVIDANPQPQAADKSSKLSGGAVAGVVITVLVIVCLAVGGSIIYYRRRKRLELFSPQHFENPIAYSSKAYDMDE